MAHISITETDMFPPPGRFHVWSNLGICSVGEANPGHEHDSRGWMIVTSSMLPSKLWLKGKQNPPQNKSKDNKRSDFGSRASHKTKASNKTKTLWFLLGEKHGNQTRSPQ